jgi:hypothetical protein
VHTAAEAGPKARACTLLRRPARGACAHCCRGRPKKARVCTLLQRPGQEARMYTPLQRPGQEARARAHCCRGRVRRRACAEARPSMSATAVAPQEVHRHENQRSHLRKFTEMRTGATAAAPQEVHRHENRLAKRPSMTITAVAPQEVLPTWELFAQTAAAHQEAHRHENRLAKRPSMNATTAAPPEVHVYENPLSK